MIFITMILVLLLAHIVGREIEGLRKEAERLREAVLELADAEDWGSDNHVKDRIILILKGDE